MNPEGSIQGKVINPARGMAFLKIAEGLRAFGAVKPGCDRYRIGKGPILNRMKRIVVNEVFDGILGGKPMRYMMDCIVDVESLKWGGVMHRGVGLIGFRD